MLHAWHGLLHSEEPDWVSYKQYVVFRGLVKVVLDEGPQLHRFQVVNKD